ncbi:2-hydroxyacyl-CoA dehydratase family protein [Trichlorobacter lovleyi]|uniref:2-hydroxyglutaryl-CoA dehydratase D-component n=1 Tax=Trichlorobacter lovleyi (strain ATCC BAA-1151 / DSM 17278 / SZ) TaxID=398767 RepID=B3E5C9_TRIL1|nr:2-hydroxyacyl-CoA dehydratase family protein [Trichlorobacter lovleyi]ACD96116.1 2-hydroxyglutaryl-CoA dehydratase D-component [Trichlorobacter lovleyi SZ]
MTFPAVRAKIEATSLLEDWSERLDLLAQQQRTAAYAFVMGSCAELLAAFEIPLFLPEINCLQSAVNGTAQGLLQHAEEQGYPSDICNYLKADVGLHLQGRRLPHKRLPAPCLAIASTACNTYIKWAEIWQRLYDMPLFVFDIPGSRNPARPSWPGDPGFAADLAYVMEQVRSLISLCERISGRRLDPDRLSHALDCTNRMGDAFRQMLAMNRQEPACFDAVRQGGAYLGVFNAYRGSEAGVRYFRNALEELLQIRQRCLREPPAEAPFRLLFAGLPCYPLYSSFIRMFSTQGGLFVRSTYLQFASGGANLEYRFDTGRPVESFAEGLLLTTREAMDSMFLAGDRLFEAQAACKADGVVFHGVKSCRTVSTGLADARLALLSRSSVPTLLLESDMMDRRLISPAQMQNRIDAFFETLRLRRQAGAP